MFRFFKSIFKSIWNGIIHDPEIKKLKEKYPRLTRFIKNRFTPDERFGLHLTIGVVVTLFFIYLFFGVLQDYIGKEALIEADLRIINLVQIFRSSGFNNFMFAMTTLGKGLVVLLGVVLLSILIILEKRWRALLALVISVGGGEIFVWIIKNIVKRSRPPLINALVLEPSYSFPSGHSFVAISFYGLLTYFLVRRFKAKSLKILFIILGAAIVFLIGFSRIYLGAHWSSDVFASYAAGSAWLAIVITALEIRGQTKHKKKIKPMVSKSIFIGISFLFIMVWATYYYLVLKNNDFIAPANIAEEKIVINCADIPTKGFENLPRMSETITGKSMEPINVILVGTFNDLEKSFQKAGWYQMDRTSLNATKKFAVAMILNRSYPQAQGLPSFWNKQPNDFGFSQPTEKNQVEERHHAHVWETPFLCVDSENKNVSRPVWFVTAHFDNKIKGVGILPVHGINPAVDVEREKIKDDLLKADAVKSFSDFQIINPTLGQNSVGDLFFTDGKTYILNLKNGENI